MAINNVQMATINYEVFVDGNRSLGTATVDLPELNYLTNEQSGAGIAGKYEVPILGHIETLEVTLHWRTIFERPTYLISQNSFMLSLRGAMQNYDAGTGVLKPMAVRIDVRALAAGLTLGKLEPAEQTDTESKLHCDYVKIMIGGKDEYEHDVFNYVHKVGGVDFLAETRKALGLEG